MRKLISWQMCWVFLLVLAVLIVVTNAFADNLSWTKIIAKGHGEINMMIPDFLSECFDLNLTEYTTGGGTGILLAEELESNESFMVGIKRFKPFCIAVKIGKRVWMWRYNKDGIPVESTEWLTKLEARELFAAYLSSKMLKR